jgi:hypothetical protein
MRYVLDHGGSSIESPEEWKSETIFDCYNECPDPCEGEETPEPELLQIALGLGWLRPAPSQSSPFSQESFPELGAPSPQPRVVQTRCGLKIEGLPRFIDLVPVPDEGPTKATSAP